MQLTCRHCNTVYKLPDEIKDGDKYHYESMRVVSDPVSEDEQVWFWCKKGQTLYLNRSCKSALDMVFLRSGQDISAWGTIREMEVHISWKCAVCGEITEIDARIPCLINEDTRIHLMRVS